MRFLIIFILIAASTITVRAGEAGEKAFAARAVIEGQIQAFLKDDAETAHGFAAPSIRAFFPKAETFMSMVRQGYKPIYRPHSYRFGETAAEEDALAQIVLIEGEDGKSYEALYELARQPDGSWKIAGVVLRELPGTDT